MRRDQAVVNAWVLYLPWKGQNLRFELIRYFEKAYSNTDQDTVLYGPEFAIVVRSILAGQRPVKLRYLTDFEGEEKSPLECAHANEVPSECTCAKNCYCKTNTCAKEETK